MEMIDNSQIFISSPKAFEEKDSHSTHRLYRLEIFYWDTLIKALGTARNIRNSVEYQKEQVLSFNFHAWLVEQNFTAKFDKKQIRMLVGEFALVAFGGLCFGFLAGIIGF